MKELKVLNLSVSSIKTYDQCPRKYYFQYILKPQIEKKEAPHLRIGQFVHAILEQFHNEMMADPAQDSKVCLARACNDNHHTYRITPEEKQDVISMLRYYMADLKKNGFPKVIANEKRFKIPIGENLSVNGFIDRIDRNDDSSFNIVDYKGLAVDTLIPTPTGWTTMGELRVGDRVFGSSGQPVNVTLKSAIHHRPCYRITLSDKSSVVCDNLHFWSVDFKHGVKNYSAVLEADELYLKFMESKINATGAFYITNSDALELPEATLPIDPWLLGAWLGDGHSRTGSFTVGQKDLSEMQALINKHWGRTTMFKDARRDVYTLTCRKPLDTCCYGHPPEAKYIRKATKTWACRQCQQINNRSRLQGQPRPQKVNLPFSQILAQNKLTYNKHIPEIYLRANFKQRLELLQGLMDTDGSWNPLRKRAVFVTAKESLALAVAEMIRTMGVTVQTFTATDNKGFVSYRIEFRPVGFNPFQLPRKSQAVEKSITIEDRAIAPRALRRKITNIEPVESVPTQCISVDAPDSLYLCGRGFIKSHNTGKSKYLDEFQLLVYGIYLFSEYPDAQEFTAQYLVLKEKEKGDETQFKKLSYHFTRNEVEEAKNKIKDVATQIREDQQWQPKPQFLCSYCDFEPICEDAAHYGPRAKKEWN